MQITNTLCTIYTRKVDVAMNSIPSSEVLIIGAGPAGLMLANILGMYGRSVTVLEATRRTHRLPARRGP